MAKPKLGRTKQGKGKKHRKRGRCLKSPAHMRYNNERRWIKNKARKIRKQMKSHPNWKPYNLDEEVLALLNK